MKPQGEQARPGARPPSPGATEGRVWQCCGAALGVFDRVHIMGILNVTPDSFSDGGKFFDEKAAVAQAMAMAADGADIIDVGGESTRPGAQPVSAAEEIERVAPVIRAVASRLEIPISIDTMKADVAQAGLEAGAVIVNDVSAMRHDPKMAEVVAASGAGVVLMHMQGEPSTMQQDPHYHDVVAEVSGALSGWAEQALRAGVAPESIAVDPGIGFGKRLDHNLRLLADIEVLSAGGYPVLVGPSRKSFIGAALEVEVADRIWGTAAVVAWLAAKGANIIRVHDVGPMAQVARMIARIAAGR